MTIEDVEKILRQRPEGWWDVLVKVIPELEPLAITAQPVEHHSEGDVAAHTRLAIVACDSNCEPDLLWAALLHDIGKPETTINQEGKITAHKHEKVGSEIAVKVLTRFRMGQNRKSRIIWAIKNHLFYRSWQLKNTDHLSRKQLSFVENSDFSFLLDLLRVDSLASLGQAEKLSVYNFYKKLKEEQSLNY